jgi:hypothetical protein
MLGAVRVPKLRGSGIASISIQYALLSNYGGLYGCPTGWGNVGGDCYYAPSALSTSVESVSTLASQPVQVEGTANYHINSGDDVVTMCDSSQCWSVANFDNAVFRAPAIYCTITGTSLSGMSSACAARMERSSTQAHHQVSPSMLVAWRTLVAAL